MKKKREREREREREVKREEGRRGEGGEST